MDVRGHRVIRLPVESARHSLKRPSEATVYIMREASCKTPIILGELV